jgi:diguanylate cyclase (GGDEF)-like protein
VDGEPGAEEADVAAFAELLPIPAMAVDIRTGQIRWANEAARRRLGPAGGPDVVGESAWSLVHPDDLPKLVAAQAANVEMIDHVAKDAVLSPAPYRVRSRTGWVSSELVPSVIDAADGTTLALMCAVPVEHHRAAARAVELLVSGAPMAEVADQVLRSATHGATLRAAGFSWDEDGSRRVCAVGVDPDLVWTDDERDPWQRAVAGDAPVAVTIDEVRPELAELARAHEVATCVAIRVDDPASEVAGCFVLWGRYRAQLGTLPYRIDGDERALLRLALARRHEHAQLFAAATTDALTGALNRRELLARLEQRLASGRPTTLHFLDLDGFKPVNDAHGHEAGDAVLREVAARLRAAAGPDDLVGRMGGDEFAVVGSAQLSAARLASAVEAPIEIGGEPARTVTVGASIGSAANDAGPIDADALVSAADAAMYEAKRRATARPPGLSS